MLTMDEVTEVIRLIQMHAPFNCLPDWPAGPDVRPGAIVKQEKRKKKEVKKDVRIDRKLKNGQKV